MVKVGKLLLFVTASSVLAMAAFAQRPDVSETGVILTGMVTSASGEKLGGATVSARRSGSTITTSVFTDEQGKYYFPPGADGRYAVRAQVVGWDKAERLVEVKGVVQRQDLVLQPTKDFFTQLSGDQMVAALPEDTPAYRRMKAVFITVCTECHSARMALSNRFDAHGWDAIVTAMSRVDYMNKFSDQPSPRVSPFQKDLVAYLTEMRGPSPSPIDAQLPPRPAGDALLPVVYEYDLPAEVGGGYVPNNGGDWSLGHPAARRAAALASTMRRSISTTTSGSRITTGNRSPVPSGRSTRKPAVSPISSTCVPTVMPPRRTASSWGTTG